MIPDRHIYLGTAILAVVLGALVSLILPHVPLAGDMFLHSGTGATTRVGPGVGLVYRVNDEAAPASPAQGVGLQPPPKWLRANARAGVGPAL